MALWLVVAIIGGAILLGVCSWWLLRPTTANPVSRTLKKWFTKTPVQSVILIGEDGVARLEEFQIAVSSFIINTAKTGAWHLTHQLALPLKGLKRPVLLLTERSTLAYNPFVTLSPAKLAKIKNVDEVAAEGGDNAIRDGLKNSRNAILQSGMIICACAVALVFLIFIGFQMWKAGAFHLGGG